MKRSIAVACTLCCLLSALATGAEVDYEKAVDAALKAGKLADVNRLCAQWAAADPGNERPRILLGRALLKVSMADRAVEQFELAAEANPLSPAPRCEMGNLFLRQGKPDAAAKEFGEALRLDSACPPAILGKARIKLMEGDAKGALADAKRTLASNPESAQAHVTIGNCLFVLGQLDKALAESRRAVELEPENADALFGLAKACQAAGNEARAQNHWKRFLEVEQIGRRADTVRNGWVVLGTSATCKLDDSVVHGLAWSPDGRRIAIAGSMRGSATLALWEKPSQIREIATSTGKWYAHPAWSPDGRYVAMLERDAEGNYFVIVVGSDGSGGPRQVGTGFGVTWSPSHDHLLYCNACKTAWGFRRVGLEGQMDGRHLLVDYMRDAEGRKWRTVQSEFGPSPRRVFCAAFGPNGACEIFARDVTGSGKAVQLTRNGCNNSGPHCSPDGRGVAYTSNAGGKAGIWLVAPDGSAGPTLVAEQSAMASKISLPGWRPDGSALAYGMGKQVVLARLGGLDPTPLAISAKQETERLCVTLANLGELPQTIGLGYEVFDPNSIRIAKGTVGGEDMILKPGDVVESEVGLGPASAERNCVVKLTAVTADGRRAIKLVDVTVP